MKKLIVYIIVIMMFVITSCSPFIFRKHDRNNQSNRENLYCNKQHNNDKHPTKHNEQRNND